MAKRIDSNIVDRILSEARIEEVVSDFIDLKKRGVRYLGLCPFHDDHHVGSFVVYPKGNCFKCFVCDAKGGVVDFLMMHEKLSYPDAIRWLGKKYNIETDMKDFNYTPPPPRPKPAPLPMLTLPMGMVAARENIQSGNLVNWIRTGIRWDNSQRGRIDQVLTDYHLGYSRYGHNIFWQIDDKKNVRTGKLMKYRTDGHRDKVSSWNFDFIHAMLFRDDHFPQYSDDKYEMRQTFFGMHLLNKYGGSSTVCLVESEKTALLMAIAYGNNPMQVWMACGGLENISRERLAPIISARRRIVLYPDRDGVKRWQQKAESIYYDRLTVDATPVTKWWLPEDGEKADIADVVIRSLNTSRPMTTIEEVAERVPQVTPLIKNLNLTIANGTEE